MKQKKDIGAEDCRLHVEKERGLRGFNDANRPSE
jgi:hypothetical protein